jgi:hypothetical protein
LLVSHLVMIAISAIRASALVIFSVKLFPAAEPILPTAR